MTKILVVESNAERSREVHNTLCDAGCHVRVVDNAEGVLDVAASDKPDLVLMATELTGGDGFSVCNRLKAGALRSGPVVLLCSASV